ncbi:MAG: beta-ketoacyl-ACP synthase [Gammaproteobacteria bacterium]|nr:MAG: beta-ketoacyl-ACP synthase [Gammaproteobacteria bacterium]
MNTFVNEPIYCVGTGIISSIGANVQEFSNALKNGVSGISWLKGYENSELPMRIGAQIPDFSFTNIKVARRSPFTIQTSVIAVVEAWHQARLSENQVEPERIGLVIAGQNTTQNYQYALHAKFIEHPEYLSPRYALQFLETDQVGVISEIFNIQGEGFVVGGASASGNVAIIKAQQLIQAGIVDVCLVVGVVADLSPMDIQGFYNIGAMGAREFKHQPEKASRPFDDKHEGFIYGQASGCLVLESASSMERRKITPNAELLGGSLCLAGNSTSEPNLAAEVKVMKTAIKQSHISSDRIDYLNAHGSSSPLGDQVEVEAIISVFGGNNKNLLINSTKGLIGHCLYSAGVVEAIATIVQMQNNFIHPNKNLENPISDSCQFSGGVSIDKKITYAMSNSFGFGGINTSIILKSF